MSFNNLKLLGFSLLTVASLGALLILASPSSSLAEINRKKGKSETELKKEQKAYEKKYLGNCPPGTEPFGKLPPEGARMWCRAVTRKGYVQHGAMYEWYTNGQQRHEGEYYMGKKHGTWTTYHRNGMKKAIEEWQNGKLQEKSEFDRGGQPVKKEDSDKKRKQLREQNRWRNNAKY